MYRKHALNMRYRVNWGEPRRRAALGIIATTIATAAAVAGAGTFYLYWFLLR